MDIEPIVVHPRFAFTTTVMVREAATAAAILATLKNISLSGCYLETPRQIPEGSRVRLVLQTPKIRADVWGMVRRRDATGLGIQFTNGATVEDWKRLESLIKSLQDSIPSQSSAAAGSK
jgi:PilZ domain